MTAKESGKERLIVALDFPKLKPAQALVERLDGYVHFYKIGLEMFSAGDGHRLLDWLIRRGCKVFVDLKMYDIPNTVGAAIARLADSGANYTTVHGDTAMLAAAVNNKGEQLKVLAVTVLTNMQQKDLDALGFAGTLEALVLARAKQAQVAGCDGLIASGHELIRLRENLGQDLIMVTPGIRSEPQHDVKHDDQKRTVTAEQAIANGANHVVIGRPISRAQDPVQAVSKILARIACE